MGTVNIFELSLDSASNLLKLQPTAFTLATLTFHTIGIGTSPVTISVHTIGDQNGSSLPVSLQNGSINVTSNTAPTPEPGMLGIMAFCITALVGFNRKQFRRI